MTSTIYDITTPEQLKHALNNFTIVVVDVHGDFCQPCKVFSPKFTHLSQVYANPNVIFLRSNVEQDLIHVTGLPSIVFYENGHSIKNILGGDVEKVKETLNILFKRNGFEVKEIKPSPDTTGRNFAMGENNAIVDKPKVGNNRASSYMRYDSYNNLGHPADASKVMMDNTAYHPQKNAIRPGQKR